MIQNPFEIILRKLDGLEIKMNKLESRMQGIDKLTNKDEPATRKEAAKYLGVSLGTISNLTKSNQLTPIRIGTSVRFSYADLDAFIAKRKQA